MLQFERVGIRYRIQQEKEKFLRWTLVNILRRRYRTHAFWALRDVSFRIKAGETFGVIGENGSGKSTLLKAAARILRPDEGNVTVNGKVGALLELGAGFQPDLSGRENIYLNGSILGLSRREIDDSFQEIVHFAELEDFIDTPVKHYSSGMYMRLGFSVAININPDILLIDEVLAVGDQAFQDKCYETIREFQKRGKTILFVSHNLSSVRELCSRALWLHQGKPAALGTTQRVVDFYKDMVARTQEKQVEIAHQEILEDLQERWGSREVELTAVHIHGDKKGRRNRLVTGEPLTIEIHYRARHRVEKPVFGIGIHRSDGIHVTGPNTRFADRVIDSIRGEGAVRYRMPANPLLPGTYYLSVAVYEYECEHPFDHHEQLYPFIVREGGTEQRFGLIEIPAEWEYL